VAGVETTVLLMGETVLARSSLRSRMEKLGIEAA
jgi:hypothetical protein